MPPTQPAVPMPPVPGVDAPINSPLLNSPVHTDPSVFFDGERFGDVQRMQLPFHPITYVNREVQASQLERERTDARGFSDPRAFDLDEQRLASQSLELGFDPAVFVTRTVRDTQEQARFLSNTVAG